MPDIKQVAPSVWLVSVQRIKVFRHAFSIADGYMEVKQFIYTFYKKTYKKA